MRTCTSLSNSALLLCITSVLIGGCISRSDKPDSGGTAACNEGHWCNYDMQIDPAPMGYRAFFFDYVCSDETIDGLDPGLIPDEGCYIILVGAWRDAFADTGCEDHCIKSGWICHYVDVETDTAWVERKFAPGDSPVSDDFYEIWNPTILYVPYKEKVYRFDQIYETWTWEEPPTEFKKVLSMVRCKGCEGGSHDIVLPLE